MAEIADEELAGYLSAMAFIEIRHLARRALRDDALSAEALARIQFLADLCHNMPSSRRSWRGRRRLTGMERAMRARRMSWVWNTANPEKRKWIIDHIEKAGFRWTPPPPLPASQPIARAAEGGDGEPSRS